MPNRIPNSQRRQAPSSTEEEASQKKRIQQLEELLKSTALQLVEHERSLLENLDDQQDVADDLAELQTRIEACRWASCSIQVVLLNIKSRSLSK